MRKMSHGSNNMLACRILTVSMQFIDLQVSDEINMALTKETLLLWECA